MERVIAPGIVKHVIYKWRFALRREHAHIYPVQGGEGAVKERGGGSPRARRAKQVRTELCHTVGLKQTNQLLTNNRPVTRLPAILSQSCGRMTLGAKPAVTMEAPPERAPPDDTPAVMKHDMRFDSETECFLYDIPGDELYALVLPVYRAVLKDIPYSTLQAAELSERFLDHFAPSKSMENDIFKFVTDCEKQAFGFDCLGLSCLLQHRLYSELGLAASFVLAASEANDFHIALVLSWEHAKGDRGTLLLDVGLHFPLPFLARQTRLRNPQEGKSYTKTGYYDFCIYKKCSDYTYDRFEIRRWVPSDSKKARREPFYEGGAYEKPYIYQLETFRMDQGHKEACKKPPAKLEFRKFNSNGECAVEVSYSVASGKCFNKNTKKLWCTSEQPPEEVVKLGFPASVMRKFHALRP